MLLLHVHRKLFDFEPFEALWALFCLFLYDFYFDFFLFDNWRFLPLLVFLLRVENQHVLVLKLAAAQRTLQAF